MSRIHRQWELPTFYRVQGEAGESLFSPGMATFIDRCHHHACEILGGDPRCDRAWASCSVPAGRVRRATRIQVGAHFVDVAPPAHTYYPLHREHYPFVGGQTPTIDYGNHGELYRYRTLYPENSHLQKIDRIAQARTNIINRRTKSNGISGALLAAFVAGCTFGFLGIAGAVLPLLVIGGWMAMITGAALLIKWGFALDNQAKDRQDAEIIRTTVNQLRKETQPQWHPQPITTQVPLQGEPISDEEAQTEPVLQSKLVTH